MSKKQNETEENLNVVDYMDKFSDWAEKNSKSIVLGFMVFTLAVVAFWGVSAMKTRALNVAAHDTGVVNRRIDLLEKAISEVKDQDSESFKTSKEEEIQKIHTEALSVLEQHKNKAVSDFTIVRWASFLVEEEKSDLALETLSKATPKSDRELSVASVFLKASILAEKGDLELALNEYDYILNQPSWKLFHAEALIQKGALLEFKGNTQDAIALFTQAEEMQKDSAFAKDAAKYKRFLQIKKNHPELFKSEG